MGGPISAPGLFSGRDRAFFFLNWEAYRLPEQTNAEITTGSMNAFNDINFRVGAASSDVTNVGSFGSATFGQTREAYRGTSTTNDPGGIL